MSSRFATTDLAIDHTLANLSTSFRFILDVTPMNANDVREDFLAGRTTDPQFVYRELSSEPEVLEELLAGVDLMAVSDASVAALLRGKHRELSLQLEMLKARDSEDFRNLSIELYGGVSPDLRRRAENILTKVPPRPGSGQTVGADDFLALANEEIAHYRSIDPDISMQALIRDDVAGVMVSGDSLLIGPETAVARERVHALLQHEVGTHLVTQVNGAAQPIQVLGTGLAGYDETQEGLAVLAEIAVGELTASRVRQLAARVLAVDLLVGGASFAEVFDSLRDAEFTPGAAYTTTMRVFRSGGLTKDAAYLRGLAALLDHLGAGGTLELFWLGKFALADLPLIADLHTRGMLNPPRILPRYLDDPDAAERLAEAASIEDRTLLVQGAQP